MPHNKTYTDARGNAKKMEMSGEAVDQFTQFLQGNQGGDQIVDPIEDNPQ
jgi:hypothetical protein